MARKNHNSVNQSIPIVCFLQLPNIISRLEKLGEGTSDASDGDSVYKAVIQLLTYMPLLDIADTKCKSVAVMYLYYCCFTHTSV